MISGTDICRETAKWRDYYVRKAGPEEADDLIASAHLQLWRMATKIESLPALTCIVLRRCWFQKLKKSRREIPLDDSFGKVAFRPEYPDFLLRKKLCTAASKLSPTQLKALRTSLLGDTADKNHRFHAIEKLRKELI